MTSTRHSYKVGKGHECRNGSFAMQDWSASSWDCGYEFGVYSRNFGRAKVVVEDGNEINLWELLDGIADMLGGWVEEEADPHTRPEPQADNTTANTHGGNSEQEENSNQEENHQGREEEGGEEVLKHVGIWSVHDTYDLAGDGTWYGPLPYNNPRYIPVRNIWTGEVRVMVGAHLAERDRTPCDTEWRGIMLNYWALRFLAGPWQLIEVANSGPLSEIFPEPGKYVEVRDGGGRRLFKAEEFETPLCDRHWFVHVDAARRVSFWERITGESA